jgi:hypothetical protein
MHNNNNIALRLAGAGIPIFPATLAWNERDGKFDKKPAITDWQTLASTEPEQIQAWWRILPAAVPGIELGRAGLIVIDVDRHAGAPDGVAAFRTFAAGHDLPACPITRTASGGYHLYFRQPEGAPLGNGKGNLPAGIDIRGKGGWVVAAGTVCGQHAWRAEPNKPALCDAPPLPDWLRSTIKPAPKIRSTPEFQAGDADARLRGLVRAVASAPEGERNHILFWAACRAGEDGGGSWAEAVLLDAAERCGLPTVEA